MKEPSVLDYLKSLLNPWQKEKIHIPAGDESESISNQVPFRETLPETEMESAPEPERTETSVSKGPFPWLLVLAVLMAVISQALLEPLVRHAGLAVGGYIISLILFLVCVFRSPAEMDTAEIVQTSAESFPVVQVKSRALIASLVLAFLAFLTFSSHQFQFINTLSWLFSIGLGMYAFWQAKPGQSKLSDKLWNFLRQPRIKITITPWTVILVLTIVLVVFFRFYRLNEVPGEMFSDHAEKLLDVADVLNGNHWIYFPRNTGREFIQMYLTAGVAKILGTGLSFMSLKIGTALAGLLTLPFVYLLGKELGGRRVALFALLFAGVAYWPNVISRIGLRFPLYPLFAAPVLYFLIRGLKRKTWNDFLAAGLFLGLGLHGYSPMRVIPIVVTAAVILYILHPQTRGNRKQVIYAFFVLAFIALLVFIPLFRYWVDDPDMFSYRTLTRLSTVERSFAQPGIVVFFSNLWKALIMFFWDNGSIWVHSIPGRPALAVVPAALFFLSIVYLIIRYIRKHDWLDLFLLVSVPLLMMPSILSLAFPEENPSLNRTGAAMIPVFVMIAMLLEFVLTKVIQWHKLWGKVLAAVLGIFLLLTTINQDYNLVFKQFDEQFLAGAWNTSEIGEIIRGFTQSTIGSRDTAYVVPFPYWVDTRLVGINAGFPEKDYALWPQDFSQTLSQSGAKLFIIKTEDQQSILDLQALYPQSSYWLHTSELSGKDFWILLVPPDPTVVDIEG